jgi:hypothetical protein
VRCCVWHCPLGAVCSAVGGELIAGLWIGPSVLNIMHAPFVTSIHITAYNDALERVLGAPADSANLMDVEALGAWFSAPRATLSTDIGAAIEYRIIVTGATSCRATR